MNEILVDPSLQEAEKAVNKAFQRHAVAIIVGDCSVQYHGRASSKLTAGERVAIIKEDGALLVHRPSGYEPVNWMPGQNIAYDARTKDKMLEIRAVRRKPVESIRLMFDRIQLISCMDLHDSGDFSLHASEEDMHRAILLKPSLLEAGFKPISYEKKVEPGFMDIYGIDKNGRLVVVEVKRKTAGKEAVLQLAKYLEAVRRRASREVRGILAAPDIARNAHKTLATFGLEFLQVDPRKCAETLQRTETRKLAEFFSEENKL